MSPSFVASLLRGVTQDLANFSQRCDFLTKRTASGLFVGVFLLSVCEMRAEGDGPVLWEADFSQLEPGPAPDLGKAVEIREESGVKFLSKLDSETEFLFLKDSQKSASDGWMDYVFKVRYRETANTTVSLVVKARGRRDAVPYLQYYVGIGQKGLGVLCHGIPKEGVDAAADDPRREANISYEDMGVSVLPTGEWITAEVWVGEEIIRISVDAGDQEKRTAEFKVFPGTGGVSVLTRSPIDVQSASVREAEGPVVATP